MTEFDGHIAKRAAKEALQEFLEVLGLDVTTAAARVEVQRDFAHLRTLRLTGLIMRDKVVATFTGSAVTGILAAAGYWMAHH